MVVCPGKFHRYSYRLFIISCYYYPMDCEFLKQSNLIGQNASRGRSIWARSRSIQKKSTSEIHQSHRSIDSRMDLLNSHLVDISLQTQHSHFKYSDRYYLTQFCVCHNDQIFSKIRTLKMSNSMIIKLTFCHFDMVREKRNLL